MADPLRRTASGSDAMGDERLEGVDRVTGAGTHLEVQVRAGAVAGAADGADDLAGADLVTDGDRVGRQVAVPQFLALLGGDDDLVAVGEIGRATCRERCVSTCRSRWSPVP